MVNAIVLEITKTETYQEWYTALRDREARTRIDVRIRRLAIGNPGKSRNLGGAISEMKIDYGPGYRLYFTRRGPTLILLLCGGDKSSQSNDIETARKLSSDWAEEG
jgi:putative addiction module killer protein